MSMPAYRNEDAMAPAHPKLISVEGAKQLDVQTVKELFTSHINPGQVHFLKLLGFDKILVDRAEGMHYITKDGRKILDFFGGFCSVAFGHNHPRIVAARKKFQDENRHEICILDTSKAKRELGWKPKHRDEDMLLAAYTEYRKGLEAHQQSQRSLAA